MKQLLDHSLRVPVVALALLGCGSAHADWSLHTELGFFDLDNFDDDGIMLMVGGGYQVWAHTSVKADYGLTLSDAETPSSIPGVTVEADLTQIRFYLENHFPFGDTGLGAHFRYGLVRLDAESSLSGSSASTERGEESTTNFHFGGGLNWSPDPQHRLSLNIDLPDGNITTMTAGYEFRF